MKEQIVEVVTTFWKGRGPALSNTLNHALRQVQGLLALEEQQRTAYSDSDRLGKSLGGFGSESLDLGALSSVLQQGRGSRKLEAQRHERLQGLAKELEAARDRFAKKLPAPATLKLAKGASAVLEAFEMHMAPLSEALRLVRQARLEARGRYDPKEHDSVFASFNWRQLESAELALCPPFVVYAEPDLHVGAQLGPLLELAASGRPIKLIVLHGSWQAEQAETGRAAALRGMGDASLLFLGLRSAYFVQTSVASPTPLPERVVQALESPRPAVISVYADGSGDDAFEQRAAQALASRAFPHFVYDPERAPDFVRCLDLTDNPEPEAQWVSRPLVYVDGEDGRSEIERPLTFADYAAGEPEFAPQFTPLTGEQEGAAIALTEFLELEVNARWNRVPFVHALDGSQRLVRLVPSTAILAHTLDRMHLWTTLQELSGIQNPFVRAAEQRIREEMEADKAQALAEQKAQLEATYQAAQQEQVASAMRTLAGRLTGMTVSGAAAPTVVKGPVAPQTVDAGPAPQPAAAPDASAEAVAAPPAATAEVAEEPWIDERLCTSCDECIAINKRMFAYNGSKKAIFKDPRAGPYKDIVRAAEKCSSGAIHPGLPLDPAEKDAEKWIKRAEPFQ